MTHYDAFISYRRSVDSRLADALKDGLHSFARPLLKTRALHVFLDRADIAINPALWPTIRTALDQSRYLILLACPESATSPAVQIELRYWLQHDPHADRVLVIKTGGTIGWTTESEPDWSVTTALAKDTFAHVFRAEPTWRDLAWARDTASLTLKDMPFREAVAEIAAPLHGRTKSDLYGADQTLAKRVVGLKWAGAIAVLLLAVLSGATLYQRNQASASAATALREAVIKRAAAVLEDDPTSAALVLRSLDAATLGEDAVQVALQILANPLATPLSGPGAPFTSIEFSPDATQVAILQADGSLHAWRADGRGRPPSLAGRRIQAITFSPDGKWLLCADDQGMVLLVRSSDLQVDRSWSIPVGSVTAARFSADGLRTLILTDKGIHVKPTDGTSALVTLKTTAFDAWFTRDGNHVLVLPLGQPPEIWSVRDAKRHVVSEQTFDSLNERAAFDASGNCLVVGPRFGDVQLWRLGKNNELAGQLLERHSPEDPPLGSATPRVTSVAVSGACERIAASYSDATVASWRPDHGGFVMGDNHGSVDHVAVSADGTELIVAGDRLARRWQIRESQTVGEDLVQVFKGHPSRITTLQLSPKGDTFATGSADGTIRLWPTTDRGAPTLLQDAAAVSQHGRTFARAWGRLSFSSDNARLLSLQQDGHGVVHSVNGGALALIEAPFDVIDTLVASADVPRFFVNDGGIRASSVNRAEAILPAIPGTPSSLLELAAASPDGSRLLLHESAKGEAFLWAVDDIKGARSLGVRGAWEAAFSRDSQLYAVATSDAIVLSSNKTIPLKSGGTTMIERLAFDDTGRFVIAGTAACGVAIWSVESLSAVQTPQPKPGCDGKTTGVAMSHRRTIAAALAFEDPMANRAGAVAFWSLNGNRPAVVLSMEYAPLDVAISPNGRMLAASSREGHVRIWPLEWAEIHQALVKAVPACASISQRQSWFGEDHRTAMTEWIRCERALGR